MLKFYAKNVCRALDRQLTDPEWDIVKTFFYAGYSVNYTVEYLGK